MQTIVRMILKWFPFLSKLAGWQGYALVAAAALAAGSAGTAWMMIKFYQSQEVTALEKIIKDQKKQMELERQKVVKSNAEKAQVQDEVSRVREQLRRGLNAKNCANTPIGPDAFKLLRSESNHR